ncbi:uncharacterized protein LOC143904875 [Temnothorax americanus]|uniref:uncharacterized protein LOC143904875 n=1 Tax=Temnothorax americanus TaxID=1964332 RepID=UPI0040676D58
MQQGYEMDNLQKDPTDPRKHTIYFRINNESLPFPVGGLTTSEYISLKHNDEKAYVYVQNLIKSGAIEDEEIEVLYRSTDDVDYNPVNIETQTKPQSSKDKESVMSDDSKNIEKTKHQPRLIVGQPIADCIEKSVCLKNLKNVTTRYKQASRVWTFFERVNNLTARCTICDKIRSHHGNTTNMIQHLE